MTPEPTSIEVEQYLPHPPAKVWRALTDPERLARWLMPSDFVAVVGHRFSFRTDPRPGFDGIVRCRVLALEPERLLRWSWQNGTTKPAPERAPCPVFWSCQLNDGRTAVRYVEAGEPEPRHAGFDLARWSVALACGHTGEVLLADGDGDRVGDYLVCQTCGGGDPDFDVEIVALGQRLPDQMVQSWTVELNCGHTGTDHFIPVECWDDPAGYRAEHPRRKGLRCNDPACDQRQVHGVRRLGVLGKVKALPLPQPDPVASAVRDLRRRLAKQERQALIRQLQEDE